VIRQREADPAAPYPALVRAPGLEPTPSELRAARLLYLRGNEVVLRSPGGSAVGGGASDLLVNGRRWDVFTPRTKNPDRIISALAARRGRSPVEGMVVDLSQSRVAETELTDVESRLGWLGTVTGDVVVLR
jgi:hypothetical protein